ncbi:MAG: tetratricopeptide repeat protein [Rubrivivax sp.]|nr:tetratricopeptide repeat protein [Rubrivivax sp.]MDH5339396.1 tetratricopeptide repeat protein [Rubrivivax sp.]
MNETVATPLAFDVLDADFETAVVQRSHDVPVLLDCWAPWCAPCRSLKPVLERLAAAYEGRFVLAKLNSDENPQVAALLGLRSIPLVVLFKGGVPVDQFNGALSESQVRAFLEPHLQPPSEAEQLRREARGAAEDVALALLRRAHGLDPDDAAVRSDLAERLCARLPDADAAAEARQLLAPVPEALRDDRQRALQARLDFAALQPSADADSLRQRIAANPRDHAARFDLAALHAHGGDFEAAFDALLEIVLRDKADAREQARARIVEWFTLCPDALLVDRARRRLAMYLN